MSPKVSVDRQRLAEFCQQNGVRRLAVFRVRTARRLQPGSDIDVLVEFEAGRTPGSVFIDHDIV